MYSVPIAGHAINTAQISIDTTITSGNISCTNISGTNATFNSLETVTFNPQTLNTHIVNTDNLNVVNTIPLLNVSVLNASQKNVSNMSVTNLSATFFTADNISTGSLVAGTNINISNNVISAENDALLPANANFSSVNSCSLSVTGTTILGGTSYVSDSLIVTNAVNTSTITANNLSTGDMQFTSPLFYDANTKILSCAVQNSANSGNLLPVTSNALYQALANFSEQPSLVHVALYRSGTVNYDVTIVNSSLSAGASGTLFYIDYNPKFEDSLIKATAYFSYDIGGTGSDSAEFQLKVHSANNTFTRTHQIIYQKWTGASGGGTRSGAGSAIGGVYLQQDTITTGLFHRIEIYYNNNTNDTFSLTNSGDYISVEVLEALDTQSTYNNNIRIGSGNISCGNIDCNNLSCNILSPISMNIQVSDSNIGGMTMGFSPTSIASESSITMASGGVFTKTVQMENLSDDFNISSRSSGKTFRFSGGQVPLLEISDTNTSCQDLIVHGNLDVVGNISFTNSEHGNINASNIITDTLLVNSVTTLDDVDINGVLEISDIGSLSSFNNSFDNMSANNASIVNLSITGSITGSNLSTASLTAGNNISILNGSISAYIEGGTEWNVSSIHVDNDVGIAGNLNVSETSTFEQSLNVENQLFVGKSGNVNGQMVLYSNVTGNNIVISNNGDSCSITGQGLTDEINISLGGNEIMEIFQNFVFINGNTTTTGNAVIGGNLNVSGTITGTLQSINSSVINSSTLTSVTINSSTLNTSSLESDIANVSLINNSTLNSITINNTTLHSDLANVSVINNSTLTNKTINSSTITCTTINTSVINHSTVTTDLANVSVINNSTLNSKQINNSTIDSDNAFIASLNVSIVNVCNNVNVCGNVNVCDANVSGWLNVSGYSYFQENAIFFSNIILNGDAISIGDPNGGSNSEIYIYSNTAGDYMRMSHISETEFIFRLYDTNETMNFLVGNASILTLDNSQARFHKNVNLSYTLSATVLEADDCNIELINASNMSADIAEITNLFGNNFSAPFMNCSQMIADDFINNTEMVSPLINSSTINTSVINTSTLSLTSFNTATINSSTLNSDLINASVINNSTLTNKTINTSTIHTSVINIDDGFISNILINSIAFGHQLFFNSGSVAIHQFNSGSTHVNCGSGQDVRIKSNGTRIASFTTTNISFEYPLICTNISTTNFSATDATFTEIDFPVQEPYLYFNPLDNKLNVSVKAIEDDIFGGTINVSIINVCRLDALNICYEGPAFTPGTIDWRGLANKIETDTFNGSTMNASFLDAINASVSNDLDVDGILDCFDLIADTGTITTFDSTTANISTLNASTINGENLSTASILFSTDFQFSLNTLSLAPNQTASAIQSATLSTLATSVNSLQGNFSTINADFGTIGGVWNANTVNISTLNASTINSINFSATNISATSITAPDVQPTLTAGTNITIVGNTISATGGSSFDPTNISNTNLSSTNITTTNLSSTNISNTTLTSTLINNHQNYMRYFSGSLFVLTTQTFYDVTFPGTSTNGQKTNNSLVHGSSSNSIFTIQKAGYYRFFCQVGVFNKTYSDRVTWRMRPVYNGGTNNTYSQLYCYTRDNNFGNRGTVNGELIRSMSVGDTVRFRIDVGKASFNSAFGSVMSGLELSAGNYVEIQYLGET